MVEEPLRRPTQRLGERDGVVFDLVAWDAADAAVDLSVACMFEREAPGAHLTGGLLHLDRTLGGALSRLRGERLFEARELEALHVRSPPGTVQAHALLVVGLGDPVRLTASVLQRAARAAFSAAAAADAVSVAFAPSLIDSGLPPSGLGDAPSAMLSGVLQGVRAHARLREEGLVGALSVKRWTFDAGPAHMSVAGAAFEEAFATLGVGTATSSRARP
jgi:hypothetical protein